MNGDEEFYKRGEHGNDLIFKPFPTSALLSR